MKIATAQVILASPGRNFVTLKLTTDDGLVGWGDATVNGRELAVASYLRDHVAPLLPGRDAHRIEDTWHYLYLGAYWRRGPITMAAISAVDIALWDIKAKAAGLPLYQLLGGASRDSIRAYGHAFGRDIPELLDSVRASLERGHTAVRVQAGVPGLHRVYGVAAGLAYEPADGSGRPVEEDWDSRRYVRHIPRVLGAVREEFGDDIDLLHDVHHRLNPVQAAKLAHALDEFDLFWLEDITGSDAPESYRLIRQHSTVPLATGETFNSWTDYAALVRDHLIDFIRSGVPHAGGITAVRKISELAAAADVQTGFHGPTDISPIGLAAALHLDLALHNFGIQEHMQHTALTLDAFPHDFSFADGSFALGDSPGLGASLDEDLAGRFPYTPAYLPVNRLADGTIHDW